MIQNNSISTAHLLRIMATASVQTEPVAFHLGQFFPISQGIAYFHLRTRPTVFALHADKLFALAIPLGRGAIARVFVVQVLAGHVLEFDAFTPVETGEAGVLRAAHLVLVFACNTGVTLRLQVACVHVARAFAMLSIDVHLGKKRDGIGKGG